MGRKANPTVIGAFVVGAIALTVVAVLLLGSGRFFKHTVPFVTFFPGSVNGLSIGAPVKFKGVTIGAVTDIRLSVAQATREDFQIPVFLEVDPETMSEYGSDVEPMDLQNRAAMMELYKSGLRAQLQSESIVTGVLYVALDVFRDSPLKLHLPENSELNEIPAQPTPLEQAASMFRQVMAKLDKIDFAALVESLEETVAGINRVVNSPDLQSALAQLDDTLQSVDGAAAGIRDLAQSATGTIGSLDKRLSGAVTELTRALRQADAALGTATRTFDSVSTLLEPGSRLTEQLGLTLQQVGDASRAVRRLADSLEANPSAVIYGRSEEK